MIISAIHNLKHLLVRDGGEPYAVVLGRKQRALLDEEIESLGMVETAEVNHSPPMVCGLIMIDAMVESELRVLPLA